MIRFELLSGVLVLALCVYSLVDVIGRSSDEVRNLSGMHMGALREATV